MNTLTCTILIIEDSPVDRELYRHCLLADSSCIYRFLEAETAREGLNLCESQEIDAILLDYFLPDADGLSFMRSLSAQSKGDSPPVVMVIGEGDERVAVQAIKLGAEDYLVKCHLTPDVLQLTMRSALENARLRLQLQQSQENLRDAMERERMVHRITLQIRQSLDSTEVLHIAVNEVRRFLVADRAFIYRFNPDFSGEIVVESVVEGLRSVLREEVADIYFMETQGEDYRQGRIQAVEDIHLADLTNCHREMLQRFEIRANLVVPILQAERLWGLLVLNQCTGPRQWQPLEVELLQQLAAQIGIALHQAELYQQVNLALAEHQTTKAQLWENRNFIQQVLDTVPGFLYIYDLLEQRNVYTNRRITDILGYTPEEVLAMGEAVLSSLLHPDDLAQVPAQLAKFQMAQPGQSFDFEYRLRHANGRWCWFAVREVIYSYTAAGAPHQVLGLVQEISDRKRLADALQQSEERLKLAISSADMASWDIDLRTNEYFCSDNFSRMLGYDPTPEGEMTFQSWHNGVHPDDLSGIMQVINQSRQTRLPFQIDYRIIRADNGETRWLSASGQFQYGNAGEAIRFTGLCFDITERRQIEQRLRDSESQLRVGIEVAGVALARFDYSTNMVQLSPEAARMYGLPEDQLTVTRARVHATFHPEEREMLERIIAQVLDPAGDGWFTRDHRVVWPSGEVRWLTVRKQVFFASVEGRLRPDHAILAAIDVTKHKQAEAEREQLLIAAQAARAEAETANRSKDEFVAMVAHELRSPLNSIMGWAKLLRTREFNPATTAKALETIERNTHVQVQLVEDLLDVSRMVSGKLHIQAAPVNLASVIEAAVDLARPQAQAKQLQLNTEILVAPQVSGNYNRLQQVVVNLLTNAIKFTPEQGRIDIELRQIDTQVQLRVSDTGKGIAPEFLPYLFERFQQGQKNTGAKDGLGLGLAIVKNLVELHEGTVSAASPGLGQGATFTVRLPMLSVPAIVQEQSSASISATSLADVRVLVVDDEPDMLNLITFVLEEYGAVVQSATSVRMAMALLPEFQPDILLSDIAMPEGTGYDLVAALRRYETQEGSSTAPPIPAIALTAYASTTYEERSLQAGFQQHLSKPVEPDVLVNAIIDLVRFRR